MTGTAIFLCSDIEARRSSSSSSGAIATRTCLPTSSGCCATCLRRTAARRSTPPERLAQVEAQGLERDFPALATIDKDDSPFVEITPMVRIRWSELKQRFRKRK
jgi:hypothetical protein